MTSDIFSLRENDRFAVFIDGSNFHATIKALGFEVDYERLLSIFRAQGRLVRTYYYTALPDGDDYSPLRKVADWLDYNGYAMVTKHTREFTDKDTGRKRVKGNMDMELALDMLKLAPHIDHAILVSGDGDFCRLVEEVQNLGIRVTVISSIKTRPPLLADLLRRQTDDFVDVADLQPHISRPERSPPAHDSNDNYDEAEVIADYRSDH
jgi:uncharacterized LabA/DUF88 family protein